MTSLVYFPSTKLHTTKPEANMCPSSSGFKTTKRKIMPNMSYCWLEYHQISRMAIHIHIADIDITNIFPWCCVDAWYWKITIDLFSYSNTPMSTAKYQEAISFDLRKNKKSVWELWEVEDSHVYIKVNKRYTTLHC